MKIDLLTSRRTECRVGFMNEAAEQALANFQHEQAMASTHARRADGYLAQFLSLVGESSDRPTGMAIRCVREWTRWLSENGPALKATIAESTGIKFSERGTPHTFLWDESMANADDDAYPSNAICRIQGPPNPDGRGRPPMVYFLWSQRWDVHPLFGVGPHTPTVNDYVKEIGEVGFDTEAMTGVIQPPKPEFPTDPAYGEHDPFPWTDGTLEVDDSATAEQSEPEPFRFSTMDEWDVGWAETFDSLARSGSKPSETVRENMVGTLPLDAEPNAALAIAYRNAVARVQSNGSGGAE